jgi:hypothetical protein
MEKTPWKWYAAEMVETKKGYYNIAKFYSIATVWSNSMNI